MRLPTFLGGMRGRLILAGSVALLVVAAPFVYINVIRDEAPKRLKLSESAATSTTSINDESSSATNSGETSDNAPLSGSLDGTWEVADGSQVGYRAKEVLFGQDAEAVGRTSSVTGTFTFTATTLQTASFTADMTTIKSDDDKRDNQFHGRIMDTKTYPTATFKLTAPLTVEKLPTKGETLDLSVSGTFTIRGTTKNVTIDLKVRNNGGTIEINGLIPVQFSDYGIPDPSFGPAKVEGNGEIEFLLTFERR